VYAFSLPHAPHIGQQFNESSGTSNIRLSSGFGILLLLCLILLAFPVLILWVVGLTERELLVLVILSDLLLVAGLLENNLVAQSTIEAEYVATAPKSCGLCTP
jgi:hypothetical protein